MRRLTAAVLGVLVMLGLSACDSARGTTVEHPDSVQTDDHWNIIEDVIDILRQVIANQDSQ